MIQIVIGNIIALIASILMVLSGLQKKKKKILFIQIIQIGLSVISNIVLGGYTGAIINALSCVRDILCYKDKMGTKEKIIIIILAIGLSLTFNNLGWIGLLPLVATITYISFMDTKNVVKFKMLIIFSMVMWLVYDLYIKSYTSAVFDFLSIVANIIAIIQIKFGKKVLLIHGFNGIPKIFDYFKHELEELNYKVILPEFPVREEITVEGYFKIFDEYKEIFNDNLIVIAHSIGNAMFLKYISKNKFKIGKYISLAGFSKDFYNEGKDILNEKVKLTILSDNEKNDTKKLINEKYSIYSDSDHLVPIELLEEFCNDINSVPIPMKDIGHMGKKSGLEKLPEVIELIEK